MEQFGGSLAQLNHCTSPTNLSNLPLPPPSFPSSSAPMDPTADTDLLPHIKTSRTASSTVSDPDPNSPSSSSRYPPSITRMGQDQIITILHLLPLESILSFSMTCRKFHSIASEDSLWKSICRRDWGSSCIDALLAFHQRREASWKGLYRAVSQLSSLSCRRLSNGDGVVPRPRASHSLNFVSDCLVLFGGGCEGGHHLDDTWVAYIGNGFGNALSWQQVNSGIPSGRFGQSCTVVGDALILFGGINDIGHRHNDVWIGHVICEEPLKTRISWRLLDAGPITPSPRGAHAACSASDRRIVIHGGIGLYGLRLSDTWILDLSDNLGSGRWHLITNGKPLPPARSGHTLTSIGESRMVLFGGRGSGYEVLNDVWLLDTGREYPEWKELKYDPSSIAGQVPLPRVGHSATFILGSRVLIYGGEDSQRHRKDDFWLLDVGALLRLQSLGMMRTSRKLWKKLRIEGHFPSYRSFHVACTDHSGRYVFVFGGMVDDGHRAETYDLRFDGEFYLVEPELQL